MPADRGHVDVFRPFASCPDILFARTAARSDAFEATDASGGQPIIVGSAAGCDEADVATRAHNELVERTSNILAGRAAERRAEVVTSYTKLRRDGTAALDPAAWGDDPDLRDIPMLWVQGRSLIDDREMLVPAGAVFLRHRPPPGSPGTLRAGSAGIAAHATTQLAVDHALREVLERDLVARSWFEAGPSCVVSDDRTWSSPLATAIASLALEISLLVLSGPATSACLVACLHTPQRSEQSFGARCVTAPDGFAEGFERAAYEALMVRWSMSTAVAQRAWDAMRTRPSPLLPTDALEHALWTFHEQDSLGRWLDRSTTFERLDKTVESQLARAVSGHTGGDVVVVDSTAPETSGDVAVVRVLAPGARRLPAKATAGAVPHPLG